MPDEGFGGQSLSPIKMPFRMPTPPIFCLLDKQPGHCYTENWKQIILVLMSFLFTKIVQHIRKPGHTLLMNYKEMTPSA